MVENTAKPQAEPEVRDRRHEQTDVSLKGIAVFLIVMLGSAVVIHAVLWWWLQGMSQGPARLDGATRWRPIHRPLPEARREFPRLQLSPPRDLETYLARQKQTLHSYGWVNQTAGVVHIPIDRAMEIVVERGVPRWGPTNGPRGGISPLELQHQRARQATAPAQANPQ